MEDKIKEELEKIYKFKIDVEWQDFRIYKIIFYVNGKEIKINFLWNVQYTLEANIYILTQTIDLKIASLYKRKEL